MTEQLGSEIINVLIEKHLAETQMTRKVSGKENWREEGKDDCSQKK